MARSDLPPPISYKFGRGDLFRLAEAITRPAMRTRILMLSALLGLFLVSIFMNLGRAPTLAEWRFVLTHPVAPLSVAVAIAASFFSHYLSVLFYMLRFRSFAVADEVVTLRFREREMDADVGDKARSTLPWTAFDRLIVSGDRAFLRMSRYEMLTVPRRAFPDVARYEAAIAFLRTKVPGG